MRDRTRGIPDDLDPDLIPVPQPPRRTAQGYHAALRAIEDAGKRPGAGRPKSKVVVRDLGTRGIKDTTHTSFRLSQEDRALLRKLAKKKYGGITMSATLRILLHEACAKEGIG